jgi:hypothetical protein
MRRGLILGAILALFLAPAAAVAGEYGAKLTLEETTPIVDILADPHHYEGQLVRVEGPVKSVCQGKGCWFRLGEGEGAMLLVKSTGDKVLVPADCVGRTATVEGVVVIEEEVATEKPDEGEGHVCARDTIRLETAGVVLN